MKKFFILLSFSLLIFSSQAQKAVYALPLDSGQSVSGQTLNYMLPTTAFEMTVTVTKVREVQGYYADYAESLLGLNHVITENHTSYKIKAVQIKPITVPDPAHTYLALISGKQLQNLDAIKAAAIDNLPQNYTPLMRCNTLSSTPIPSFFKNYSDPSFTEMEDSFVETKIIDGVVTQVPANHTKLVSRSNKQKAQEAADAISKSRKDQYSLVAGEQETPYSAEAIDRMLSELKQWEKNYLDLFTGLVLEDELEYTFYVTPESMDDLVAFSLDPEHGLSNTDFSDAKDNYMLVFSPTFVNSYAEETASQENIKNNGFRIRNAVPVHVMLQHNGQNLIDFGSIQMLQGSHIQVLPTNQKHLDIESIGFIF
ncbi:MAG: DUF4831 family protein [Bacteroidales bacterium]|nr:DUF4831 family protein [Bacteroidales bacterium]